jgi:hypothetical protein
MGSTACTEPQCLYSRAIPLLPLWAVRPVQSLSACTRVHFNLLKQKVVNIVRVVKSRRTRWAEHVSRMGEDRGVHMVLVGKPEKKRPLGRPRRR